MSEEKILLVPIKDVTADYSWNMRTLVLDKLATDEDYQLLKGSLAEKGQDEEVIVRPIKGKPNKYQLMSGFRRYTALNELAMTHIKCKIRELTDAEARSMNIRENTARADVSVADRAWGLGQLLDLRKASGSPDIKITDESIAREVGLSTAFVNKLLRTYPKADGGCTKPVFDAWRSMAAPLPLAEMVAISELPKGGQMAAFKEKVAARETTPRNTGGRGWLKGVVKQAMALGHTLGALEAHNVVHVDMKVIQKFDFSVLFDKIPENATTAQRQQVASAMGEAYARAKLGFEDTESGDDADADSDDDSVVDAKL